eukprot:366516-Chlamydomonas_euryale.AAC.2
MGRGRSGKEGGRLVGSMVGQQLSGPHRQQGGWAFDWLLRLECSVTSRAKGSRSPFAGVKRLHLELRHSR